MEYLEKYIKESWSMNMYLSGKTNEVDWEKGARWTIPEIKKALKYFNSIAQVAEKEMMLYRGTNGAPSPLMLELAPELPGPGKEKLSQVLSTTYNKDIAHEFSRPKNKKVGYLHILKIQPGVKYIDMKKTYKDCGSDKACIREEEVLLIPGYKMILEGVKPLEYGDSHIKKWEFTWLVF
jgi:hypothetical protein